MSRDLPLKEARARRKAKKQRLSCSTCGRKVWRRRSLKVVRCAKCADAYRLRWQKKNNPDKWKKHYADNKERLNVARAEWRRQHLTVAHKTEARYRERIRAAADDVEAALACDCGASHTQERRLKILRLCADFSATEIREAYPCLWPCERTLYRDRALLSAKQSEAA
jgi:ribosomal protein L37AE/L43A